MNLEAVILGICIFNLSNFEQIQHLPSDIFQDPKNYNIFITMKQLKDNGLEPNVFLVSEHLRDKVSADYITSLSDNTIYDARFDDLVQQLLDNYTRRKICIYSEMLNSKELTTLEFDKKHKDLIELNRLNGDNELVSISDAWKRALEAEKEIYFKTGIWGVDNQIGGIPKGQQYVIIGGRPSVGKSTFLNNVLLKMSLNNVCINFYSLEMSLNRVSNVQIARVTRCTHEDVKNKNFPDLSDFSKTLTTYSLKKFFMRQFDRVDIDDLLKFAVQDYKKIKYDVLAIDYLGLVESRACRSQQRHDQMRYISASLASISKKLNITLIALVQLTRDAQDEEPTLRHIRDSGSLEQDADIIMFLHRINQEQSLIDDVKLIIAKNRSGATAIANLKFDKKYCRYVDSHLIDID